MTGMSGTGKSSALTELRLRGGLDVGELNVVSIVAHWTVLRTLLAITDSDSARV